MTRRKKEPASIAEAFENMEVLSGGEAGEAGSQPADVSAPVRTRSEVIDEVNDEFCLVLMGSKAVVMREMPPDLTAPIEDKVRVLTVEAFMTYYRNRSGFIEAYERKHGKLVLAPQWIKYAPLWLDAPTRRTYDGVEFFPDPVSKPGTPGYFNLWRGFGMEPDRKTKPAERWKKYAIFRDHLLSNICSGNEEHFRWLWAWFAAIVQKPRERVATAVVLRGKMGTGKTVAGDVIGSLFPSHYFLVDDPRYLTGQFNAHMASCLLLQVDEGFWAGDKAAEGRLKGLVSAKTQMIEAKGIDPIRLENRVRLMFSSNESWVVPAGMDERRFAVFDVASHAKENRDYFNELYAQLDAGGRAALLADLLDYPLNGPGMPDPHVIPKTAALLEQKLRSLDPVAQWWFGRLMDGGQTHRSAKWREFVPVSTCFDDYLRTSEKVGVRRKSDETAFGLRMKELLPEIDVKRRIEDVEQRDNDGRVVEVRRQVRCYLFPSLERSRELFAEALRQPVEWGEDAPAEASETEEAPVEF